MLEHVPLRRVLASLASAAVLTTTLSACSFEDARGGAQSLDLLKVSTIGLTSDGSLVTGMKKGFFAEEGIEIRTSLVKNPPAGLAAAQSGQVDVAYSPSISILTALGRHMPIGVVAGADGFGPEQQAAADPESFDDTALFAAPDSGIESLTDLAGKTISVPARKAQLEVTVVDALREAGVDPESINWVVLDFTSATAALKQSQVDAAALVNPFTSKAKAEGANFLVAPSFNFFGPSAVGMWTVGTETYRDKPETIDGFKRAIERSNAYANDHPEEATQAGIDYTKSGLSLDEVTIPYWPEAISRQDLSRVNEKLVGLDILTEPVDLSSVLKGGGRQ
ncbi:ABC transporter substrate-binding protein [Brevibacterium linens]|uniref:NitT/TauT family transport system substrate-binding protein n=1 Tax=Brevibacterium linens ATCC 9172 TaxID=1255617 RepID=A0A2H1IP07_BRELN|nr:ABC transporter substrate-binding protein [Brevibacterium linens]KAB1946780.1 PhnD/SsuA/transferrin family substrate-binding protein [Brevibacterium linens ATCC 9172]SMX76702.1 NitT/TauT family transport system substrate-binding protein [Brevibacterium linens ATCC 9172]